MKAAKTKIATKLLAIGANMAPANLPRAITDKRNAKLTAALRDRTTRKLLIARRAGPFANPSGEYATLIRIEI